MDAKTQCLIEQALKVCCTGSQVLLGGNPGKEQCSFLPQAHVKVLLVEDDDSTRHVVSALLRNCNYEVIAAPNVAMAWDLLENPNNRFDLILLDVVMPSLLGVSLLLKIMEHKSFKWIPVVMTSKQDSVEIVYQCLTKGAADFLVKPVRKNELKNLWQHVWRKRYRSANNGVGRAMKQTRNLVTPNSPVDSDNNMSGSNNVNDSENAASGLNINGGSDNGSGNQVSSSYSDQTLGCNLKMATPRPPPCDIDEVQQETDVRQKMDLDDPSFAMQGQGAAIMEKCNQQQECEPSTSGPDGSVERRSQKAVDLIGAIECQPPPTIVEQPGESADANEIMDQRGSNSPKEKEIVGSDFNSPPTLELTLKWPRNGSDKDADGDEWQGLRQSGSSAFSRYSTKGLQQQEHPPGGTPPPRGLRMDGSYGTRGLPSGGLAVNSSCPSQMGMPPDGTGSSKGSGEVCTPLETDSQNPHNGNGQDTSSSVVPQSVVQNGSKPTNKETAALHGMPRPTSNPSPGHLHYEGVPAGYGPTMHPMYYVHPGPAWVAAPSPHLSDQGEVFDHPSIYQHHVAFGHLLHPHNNQQPYYHSHHRHNTHYHEHHNHALNFQPPPLPQQQGEQPTAGSPHYRFAWREAALNKFRQKRKERCFAKKVRYQSRKKLAEQRPRVRGQFVRQTAQDSVDETS
ncbi:unnamed protein product [Sphagnum jensenii]|uniref:Uncharacterized protein n=1 Tax=Sphagnum jensenii TaxID=128206 RepID=A0ABP1A9N6_9BRYO